jgi:hypothetical protein
LTLAEVRLERLIGSEADTLRQRLESACGSEEVRLSLFHLRPKLEWFVGDLVAVFNSDLSPVLNRVSTATGFQASGGWLETDRATARWIVTMLLWRDLAYTVERIPWPDASSLAHQFFRVVSGDGHPRARYFTNGAVVEGPTMYTIDRQPMLGWHPISENTFDTGAIILTPGTAGMLWGTGED